VGAANPRVSAFGEFGVRSDEQLTMRSNATIGNSTYPTNAASNENISLDSASQICGNATPGYPDYQVTLGSVSSVCPGYSTAPATAPFRLPQITAVPEDSNTRIKVPTLDPCTQCTSVIWDPVTKRLDLNANSTLTLGGNVYNFCELRLDSNSQLRIAAGATVKIYILPPEECLGGSGGIELNSNAKIVNLSPNIPSNLQIYVVGSATQTTLVDFDSNFSGDPTLPMLLFAPNSDVILDSNVHVVGAIAARSVELDSNAHVYYDGSAADVEVIDTFLKGFDYRECRATSASVTNPAEGC
jgi:hypothetical protein